MELKWGGGEAAGEVSAREVCRGFPSIGYVQSL